MSAAHPRKPAVIASTAILRVEPTGPAGRVPRNYLIMLELVPSVAAPDTLARARTLAAGSLSGVSSGGTATEQPTLRDLRQRPGRGDAVPVASPVNGVEGIVLCTDWPAQATIAGIRASLMEHGYEVTTAERLACAEPGCTADTGVTWTSRDQRPSDWYSQRICGRHNYRSCNGCGSVVRLVSSNASGPGPSVACPVCQLLLIEWGGSKRWEVELVRRAH